MRMRKRGSGKNSKLYHKKKKFPSKRIIVACIQCFNRKSNEYINRLWLSLIKGKEKMIELQDKIFFLFLCIFTIRS
jgi:hypothetical protein